MGRWPEPGVAAKWPQVALKEPTPHLDGLAVRLPGKKEDGEDLLLLGQGHRQVEERVKGDGDLGGHRRHWVAQGRGGSPQDRTTSKP